MAVVVDEYFLVPLTNISYRITPTLSVDLSQLRSMEVPVMRELLKLAGAVGGVKSSVVAVTAALKADKFPTWSVAFKVYVYEVIEIKLLTVYVARAVESFFTPFTYIKYL